MIRAFGVALLVAVVGALVAWLFYWNGSEATLRLADGVDVKFPMAVHILLALGAGGGLVLLSFALRSLADVLLGVGRKRGARRQAAVDELRDEGTQQLWSGELKQAGKNLERAIRRGPEDLETALALARVREESGDPSGALEVLETARAVHRGSEPRLLYQIGRLALAKGKPAAAIDAFREAAQAAPQSSRILAELAHALAAEGSFAEAADTAGRRLANEQESSRQDSARHEWIGLRHQAALAIPEPEASRVALQKLSKEDPSFVLPVLELASRAREGGDQKTAERLYREALKRFPRGILFERLTSLHTSLGQAAKALPILRHACSGNRLAAPRLVLARILISSDQLDEANTELEELSRSAVLRGGLDIGPERDLIAGDLASARGNDREASTLFRRAASGDHQPFAYACRQCGHPSDRWADLCRCGSWGEFEWQIADATLETNPPDS